MNYKNYTPQENEFFAENELIQIIPNFRENPFDFISGTFGPFRPGRPVTVPLWLAVYLKQRNKCQVQLPIWLDYDTLTKIKSIERENGETFSEYIPYYYFEMANLLFTHCSDEFAHLQKMKSVVEDIFELRKEKLVRMLKRVDPETPVKYLSTAGSIELNTIRPAFTAAYTVAGQMQTILDNC